MVKAAAFDAANKGSNPFTPAISNNSNYRLHVDAHSNNNKNQILVKKI